MKIQEAGISSKTIKTLEYVKAFGSNLKSWLTSSQEAKKIIMEGIQLLKNHPLIPKNVFVSGFIANEKQQSLKK